MADDTLVSNGKDMSGLVATRPASAENGQPFYNRSTGGLETYNKTSAEWHPAAGVQASQVLFTEDGTGTYTGTISLPAGATLLDIIIDGIALWAAGTSASMKVGIGGGDDDAYFTGVNLKATDLLAGESLSFALAGGKNGASIANSQVSPRYSATARDIVGVVASSGAGDTGRTLMTVLWCKGPVADAVQS